MEKQILQVKVQTSLVTCRQVLCLQAKLYVPYVIINSKSVLMALNRWDRYPVCFAIVYKCMQINKHKSNPEIHAMQSRFDKSHLAREL